ncbi:hypothetical protein MVES1_000189 [Malassezia vespertilionis]|uniref:Mediator of RNA polymerase II transcription subunit 17 n=1 Tax=Malassezia vespertilionis TaxID=2020962 RepID=A0A2N1JH92_9BASI|nr:uncharacterized protein MVES1_000189 [Malassezia vespertilionis]PKI85912.1 hypothetical protein MVES_000185 [Malassezia vespertilionis]WFD04865.1 hypothetical protein MVES1_000189 [Malassezia vespertilionis]
MADPALALERVLHARLSDEGDALHSLLERKQALLDVQADGGRVFVPRSTPQDAARAQRMRLWAERGEFKKVRSAHLVDECEEAEAPLFEQLRSLDAPEATPAPSAPEERTGRISEQEFFPFRDTLLHQLESALFNAEQAQNLLGMLIHNARAASGASNTAVLAAQPDYFLEPQAIALSRLQRSEEEEGVRISSPTAHAKKAVLEMKVQSLQTAASVLEQGSAQLVQCAAPEKARWQALRDIQKRGWKLTPGRPLLDIERFDVGARKDALQGFGIPVLHGDGALNEEGARDAWIGYGPAEAPVELLQRTMAYWADAQGAQRARLAFPDRTRRRLRVSFHSHGQDAQVWSSLRDAPLDEHASLDAQLYDAQMDAVDTELFRELAAQSGVLAPVFARIVSESSVLLPLSTELDVRIELVEHDAPLAPGVQTSPLPSLLLAVLRLRMLRSWSLHSTRLRAAQVDQARAAEPRANVTGPVWELYKYTLYLARLRTVLDRVVGTRATYQWKPYEMIVDMQAWITSLVDLAEDPDATEPTTGGLVLVYRSETLAAQLTVRAPSHLIVFFPQHRTPSGVGLRLALELDQLEPLLAAALDELP